MTFNAISRWLAAGIALAASALIAACGGSGPGPASVPSLSSGSGGAGQSRSAALHAAAQCIRQHGIPGYQDPVLTPGGQVYTDLRSVQDGSQATLSAVHSACRALLVAADLNPYSEPPAPPQLVEAGVRAVECERAHGLPKARDPSAATPYTPGHGFGFSADEIPVGGKLSPGFQQAARACQRQVTAEIKASTLGSLGSDG